jgi:hypothetical protein
MEDCQGRKASLVGPFRERDFRFRSRVSVGRFVAPAFDYSGTLGRVKTPLRRFAVLTRPARSRELAITGAPR